MKCKNSMRKRMNLQFMLIAAGAVLVTAICATLLFYAVFKNQVYDDLKTCAHILYAGGNLQEDHGDPQLEDGGDLLQPKGNGDDQQSEGAWYWKGINDIRKDGLRITLIDRLGKVVFDSLADQEAMENHKSRPEILQAAEQGEGTSVRISDTSSVHTLYYALRLPDGKVLRIGKDSDRIYHILRNTLFLVVILSVFTLAACILLSHILTKRLLHPIERMAVNPDEAGREEIYQEIQPFIQTIREQHINLRNSAKMRQEFTANVSHELKTPLTAISGYAELIGSGMAAEKDTLHFADEIHKSSDRLLILINDIMKLSELDEKEQILEMGPVDLYRTAQGCLDMMEVQAQKQGIALYLEGEPQTIMANSSLIDELLYNLCSNAVRYNNQGGSVTVSISRDEENVLLSVRDTGIGIPKEHQERIFERFYRVDKSRSKRSGGTGLGLAIVKHIVARHKAKMELTSQEGKGTEVKIWFPFP